MNLESSDIQIKKTKLALTPKQLLWALGIAYLGVPVIGWLCFCLWMSASVTQDPGHLIYSLPGQIVLILKAEMNPVVLLPSYALCFLIFIISFWLFKQERRPLKVLAVFSMLASVVAIPFAPAIVYSLGVFFMMSISLIFSDFQIKQVIET